MKITINAPEDHTIRNDEEEAI